MVDGAQMIDEWQTVGEEFEPEKEFVLDSLEALKVTADPTRLRVLESLVEQPLTVKEVAKKLDIAPTKLYYHINLLEEHGLIRVVKQRVVSGIIEKQYRTRAYSFNVKQAMFDLDASGDKNLTSLLSVIFDATRDDIKRAFRKGLIKPTEDDPDKRNAILFRTLTKLPPERLKEFEEKLLGLIKDFNSFSDTAEKEGLLDGCKSYGLTVALFPLADDLPNKRTTIE
nr:Helix-turn-helix domain protein [uncultured bacterium]